MTIAADRIRLLGVPIDRTTATGAIERIAESIAAQRGGWVVTPNLDILRRLTRDREFAALVEPVDLRLADGMPLIWASRLKRDPLPERVAGSDLIWSLCERASKEDWGVYLLGGAPGAAEAARDELRSRYEGLRVVGVECPAMGFDQDPAKLEAIEARVAEAKPDIVFVALGCPKQERLIERLRRRHPRAWYLGVGISFSFVAGDVKRAPVWMRKTGLEWIHRLLQEPGRLAKRYLVDGVPFAIRLLMVSAFEGVRKPSAPAAPASPITHGGGDRA